jgi:hypothetical protein
MQECFFLLRGLTMELTIEAARRLINETVAQLGDAPDAGHVQAVCNRLQGMYELLKVIPSFKASRYHPRMFPEAIEVEGMLLKAIDQVEQMQVHGGPGADTSQATPVQGPPAGA